MHVKLRLGLMTGAAVAIFIVVTGTSFFSVANLIEDQTWLLHSREVMSEFHYLLFRMASAGNDERSYLLTGKQDFLDDYQTQVKQMKASAGRLKNLVADSATQTATITELSNMIDERIARFDKTLEIYQKEGADPAFERVRNEQTTVRHRVKELESAFEQEEQRLLNARHDEAMLSVRSAQLSLLAGCLLSIAFVSVFNYFFGRHITSSIRRLLNAAENAEQGRFYSISMESNDEFGELGDAFNQLSLRLDSLNRRVQTLQTDNAELATVRDQQRDSIQQLLGLIDDLAVEFQSYYAALD